MAKVEHVDRLGLRTAKYTRHYNDGTEICADLTEGPNAFAIVKIEDEVIATEMPNFMYFFLYLSIYLCYIYIYIL